MFYITPELPYLPLTLSPPPHPSHSHRALSLPPSPAPNDSKGPVINNGEGGYKMGKLWVRNMLKLFDPPPPTPTSTEWKLRPPPLPLTVYLKLQAPVLKLAPKPPIFVGVKLHLPPPPPTVLKDHNTPPLSVINDRSLPQNTQNPGHLNRFLVCLFCLWC